MNASLSPALSVLATLAGHGVHISVHDERHQRHLNVTTTSPLSDADRELIRHHKPALLEHLKAQTQVTVVRVACRDCQHFQPNPNGAPAAIGSCAIDAPEKLHQQFLIKLDRWERTGRRGSGPMPDKPLWANTRRACDDFEATSHD